MTLVATLIAADGGLDTDSVERARALLPGAGAAQWLAAATAADIPFSAEGIANESAARRDLADRVREVVDAVDVVVQPAADRRKRLFLADMDSTMIQQECIDELADFVGVKEHVAGITERAMRGEITFEPALRERVALLKGLPGTIADDVIRDRIRLTGGARTLIATMRRHGTYTCLVTGGFTIFSDRLAPAIGFDEARANRLLIDGDGKLAGTVAEPIFGKAGKLATLIELRDRQKLGHADTMATGDGANDMDMIGAAGLGIAFHAKPKVAAAAPARIDHGDLTALLYVQGYRQADFVAE
jgi:phosphoserine phosphatase